MKVVEKLLIGTTKHMFFLLATLKKKKDSQGNLVRDHTRFIIKEDNKIYYANIWHCKPWKNPVTGSELFKGEIEYVLTTPIVITKEAKKFITGKNKAFRMNLCNALFNHTLGNKKEHEIQDYEKHFVKYDINGRLWVAKPLLSFFMSFINPELYFRGQDYKDALVQGNEEKRYIEIIDKRFFYTWDESLSNEALLRYTTDKFLQGNFVKKERAMSMAQMSDHFRQTIIKKDSKKSYVKFLNMLKKFGLIHQFIMSNGVKVTMWNPAFAKAYHGFFSTHQPKNKADANYFNIYGDKNMMGVLSAIIFEPGVFQHKGDNQQKLF